VAAVGSFSPPQITQSSQVTFWGSTGVIWISSNATGSGVSWPQGLQQGDSQAVTPILVIHVDCSEAKYLLTEGVEMEYKKGLIALLIGRTKILTHP
jgi:hypothetical protein